MCTATSSVAATLILIVLWYDVWKAFWFDNGIGGTQFGIGVGTVVMLVNAILLSGYSLGCHSFRHMVGGFLDRLSIAPFRKRVYSVSIGVQPEAHELGVVQPVQRRAH